MTVQEEYIKKGRAYKIMLLFGMGSMVMIFAGLTSAYVVSKSRPDWLTDFQLPLAFLLSTIVIVLSSLTFFLAKKAVRDGSNKLAMTYLGATTLMGAIFVVLQFIGFGQVVDNGYFFTGSESTVTTSFLYVIVIVHVVHLVGGMISLLYVIYNHSKQRYNSSQYIGIELSEWFWHFLGILWIYLFLFFTFYK